MTVKTSGKQSKDSILLTLIAGKQTRFVEKKVDLELHLATALEVGKVLSRRKFILLARKSIIFAKQNKITSFHTSWKSWRGIADKSLSDSEVGEQMAVAFTMANFEFTALKTKPKEGFSDVQTILVLDTSLEAKKGIDRGILIGESVNNCRSLANTPGGDMTPALLALEAKKAVKGTAATVEVLGVKEMKKLGMGAVLAVGKGSSDEPKFIIVEYRGERGGSKKKPVVFVGKGVTFDSGGLNIKTGDGMYEMHMDMSGGAAVIHAVALCARLKLKRDVIGLVPAVENMPGNNAFRPGDVITSLSGKTIEIINTDAEGRVILADALTYAKRYTPEIVVEASTLTGAALVALGQHASALMTTDTALERKLRDLGERSGDYLWPMPLWDEYDYMLEANFADIPNLPVMGNSRYGGTIAGGKFLQRFAEGYLFAHLDIAPRMTSTAGDNLAKGAAGTPVRLFLQIAENF